LLANAVAATRPQHKPLSIHGKLARTFAKCPSHCASLVYSFPVSLSSLCTPSCVLTSYRKHSNMA
jgi:hypothetical protein